MNEQKKVTLPGSISNIPTTNYGRAYSIVSTWAHHYTPDEMKRLLIGRGVDINDIDVEAMHKACTASLEGLTAPAGGLEITYEDGTKESRSASASLMQPKTPEEQENAWTERKRGLIVAALARYQGDAEKLVGIEKLTQRLFSKGRTASESARDLGELMDLLGANTLNEDPAWAAFKENINKSIPGVYRSPVPEQGVPRKPMLGDWMSPGRSAAIKHTGESEFSRISDLNGTTNFKSGNETINRLLSEGYHLDEVKLADLGVGKLLDSDGLKAMLPPDFKIEDAVLSYRGMTRPLPILTSVMEAGGIFHLPKSSPVRERLAHPYDHFFSNYTPEYQREQAIKRKAKRIKNQRRRRNAKARRK